jgi:hypothetical protein
MRRKKMLSQHSNAGFNEKTTADRVVVLSKSLVLLRVSMLAKMDEASRWSHSHLPTGLSKEKFISGMKTFISDRLADFLNLCMQVLPYFTQEDGASIGADIPSENAKKFIALFQYLEANGFPGPGAYHCPINFWSGEEARRLALRIQNELSDDQVPAVAAMFAVCSTIQELQGRYDEYVRLLSVSISKVYALHANGTVNVYISSDKLCEESGFTVGNNFWDAELATLQLLAVQKKVADIHVRRYDHANQAWHKPVSLLSREGSVIPVRRRCIHRHDDQAHSARFKAGKSEAERQQWRHSHARPSISYGSLKNIAVRWRAYATCRLFAPVENRIELAIDPVNRSVPKSAQ